MKAMRDMMAGLADYMPESESDVVGIEDAMEMEAPDFSFDGSSFGVEPEEPSESDFAGGMALPGLGPRADQESEERDAFLEILEDQQGTSREFQDTVASGNEDKMLEVRRARSGGKSSY